MPHPERDRRPTDYRAFLDAYARAWHQVKDDPTEQNLRVLLAGEEILYRELMMKPGRFELGMLLSTPGAITAMELADHIPPEFLLRHKHGDWGELPPADARENEAALVHESRLVSAYRTRRETKLWVITEWDRSATTILLPGEY